MHRHTRWQRNILRACWTYECRALYSAWHVWADNFVCVQQAIERGIAYRYYVGRLATNMANTNAVQHCNCTVQSEKCRVKKPKKKHVVSAVGSYSLFLVRISGEPISPIVPQTRHAIICKGRTKNDTHFLYCCSLQTMNDAVHCLLYAMSYWCTLCSRLQYYTVVVSNQYTAMWHQQRDNFYFGFM